MTLLPGALAVIAMLLVGAPAAGAETSDRAASVAFIADATTLDRTLIVDHLGARDAGRAFAEQIATKCPGAFASFPDAPTPAQLNSAEDLVAEAELELFLVDADAQRGAVTRFLKSIAGLHWSRRGISRAVGAYREYVLALFTLASPDFCADASTSAAGGFETVPAETTGFVHAFKGPASAGLAPLAARMAPLLARSEMPAVKALERLGARLEAVTFSDNTPSEVLLKRILPPV